LLKVGVCEHTGPFSPPNSREPGRQAGLSSF
jgi:hypothetical protein